MEITEAEERELRNIILVTAKLLGEHYQQEHDTIRELVLEIQFAGERVRVIREYKGISKHEFARYCGITKNILARYENGTRKPCAEHIRIMAKYLRIDEDLLTSVPWKAQSPNDSEVKIE